VIFSPIHQNVFSEEFTLINKFMFDIKLTNIVCVPEGKYISYV